ncbi:MAG: hypothetical protein WBE21_06320 [Candidatus Acidiferrales bacterium]|jgi:hypothetical protein
MKHALPPAKLANLLVAERLPKANMVTFYALTDEGVFTSSASVADLSSQRSPLSELGNAAQEIITLYQALKN